MVLVTCAVMAGLGELVVRARIGSPLPERLPILEVRANPYRGWEMVPGVHYTYEHPVHVNALGLRGEELGPKRPDELRVLALGDSLVYGQGVGDDETLPAFLEQALSRDAGGRMVRVVNAGHRAYDTRQELGLLEELGERIAPDVVILFWFENDFFERDIDATAARLRASGPIAFDTGGKMEGATLLKWRLRQLARRSALVMLVHDLVAKKPLDRMTPEVARSGLDRLGGYLERFQRLGKERDFRPLFCVIPSAGFVRQGRADREPDRSALEVARRAGLAVLDLYGALEPLRADGGPPTVPFDGHYAPAANRAMAEAVAAFVRANL